MFININSIDLVLAVTDIIHPKLWTFIIETLWIRKEKSPEVLITVGVSNDYKRK